jgi:hypothetical protein
MKGSFYFFLFILCQSLYLKAQETRNFIPLFDSTHCIYFTLTFNFDSLYKGGQSEVKEYPAILGFSTDNIPLTTIPVGISKRGHFRKNTDNCTFPPLRLHFKNNSVKGTLFEGLKKLKIVTHCQNKDTLFDQYILLEYYLYRIYNILTERSFKVRLVRCFYTDSKCFYPNIKRWGILLENPKDLAYRINGEILDVRYLTPKATNLYYYALMRLFQNMIINRDWSIGLLHNIELVGMYPDFLPVPIPFDFDMAGLIHIPYNSPSVAFKKDEKPVREFPIKKVPRKAMKKALEKVKHEKKPILALFEHDSFLTDSIRNRVIESIKEFYKNIENK